ncbi:hypothetical protein ACLOJK_024383 [Asimina triloba]
MPHPSPLPWETWDQAQDDRYVILAKLPIMCTRYIDDVTIDYLGLTEEVHGCLANICVGGLITCIANHFGFIPNLALTKRIEGMESIELEMLLHMGMIRREGEEYFVIGADGRLAPKERPRGATPVFHHGGVNEAFQVHGEEDHEPPVAESSDLRPSTSSKMMEIILAGMNQMQSLLTSELGQMSNEIGQLKSHVDSKFASVDDTLHRMESTLNEILLSIDEEKEN